MEAVIECPAMIYKSSKNNNYIANCIIYNLAGYGKTENEAISNLENTISKTVRNYTAKIKPVYGFNLH